MTSPAPIRFGVAVGNIDAALAHLAERGFAPAVVETDDEGVATLIFAPLPDKAMHGLAMALPVHLSTKIGIVAGNPAECDRLTRGLR